MAEIRELRLDQLRLDPVNPRLDDGTDGQRQAITAMMKGQGTKLVALARDISKQGLSPIERFLVTPAQDEPDEYIVLEGNRRLTAIKLLLNPDVADAVLGNAAARTLRELAADLQFQDATPVECAIVESRDEALHWLRLRHGVGLDGAGTERWGTPEQERFDLRNGRVSPEMKVLNFLTQRKAVTPEQLDSISITNLRRLLNDPDVRDVIGIDIDRKTGAVTTRYPVTEVAKPLARIASELAADKFKVGDIYTKEDRKKFLKRLGKTDRPNQRSVLPISAELQVSAISDTNGATGTRSKRGRVSKRRATVAPSTLALKIPTARIRDIYRELQRLKVEEFANAGAVLMRVFLELSVDRFLRTKRINVKQGAELGPKLQAVHDRLLGDGVMTRSELTPIRKAISSPSLINASISTFNVYVHSHDLTPSPNDVRAAWDNLQLFFERLWNH